MALCEGCSNCQTSGKTKVEKRLKKQLEIDHCNAVAGNDTTGTMLLMRQRQVETGTAHVVLASSQFLA